MFAKMLKCTICATNTLNCVLLYTKWSGFGFHLVGDKMGVKNPKDLHWAISRDQNIFRVDVLLLGSVSNHLTTTQKTLAMQNLEGGGKLI